jgi:hypothetical protein
MLYDECTCVLIEYKQSKVMRTALFWAITLRNNQEERISQILRSGSMKSRNGGLCLAARFY